MANFPDFSSNNPYHFHPETWDEFYGRKIKEDFGSRGDDLDDELEEIEYHYRRFYIYGD